MLTAAPGPAAGARLSAQRVQILLWAAGLQRNLTTRAEQIVAALHGPHLSARPGIEAAYIATTGALIAVITALSMQIEALQEQLQQCSGRHPDAEICRSQPGLGVVLGARVLAKLGDDPHRYADARARKNYSGMSPVTHASGKMRAVLARYARNRRLGDALVLPGLHPLGRLPRGPGLLRRTQRPECHHHQALRAVANRLVGILHGCPRRQPLYDEGIAWAHRNEPSPLASAA